MTIGLTYTGDEKKHQNYINWLRGDDAIEIIELSAEKDNAVLMAGCDALVLSGGIDISPELSGGAAVYPHQPATWNRNRDSFEKSLYAFAIKQALPVLGICRGLQLVNVLEGGSLVDDLGGGNDQHKNDGADKDHIVFIEPGTLLNEIVSVASGQVNSAHHQAIQTTGATLLVNSRAADGTIEGVEWKEKEGKAFLLCVQWHPERMFEFPHSPLSENIRNRFIQEISQSISAKK